jgi:hypothetical protein
MGTTDVRRSAWRSFLNHFSDLPDPRRAGRSFTRSRIPDETLAVRAALAPTATATGDPGRPRPTASPLARVLEFGELRGNLVGRGWLAVGLSNSATVSAQLRSPGGDMNGLIYLIRRHHGHSLGAWATLIASKGTSRADCRRAKCDS